MYKPGDKVVHQMEGACFVTGLMKMEHNRTQKEYYILEPIRDKKSRLYISKNDTSNRIRPAISQQDMSRYKSIADSNEPSWIADVKIRNQTYSKIIRDFDFLKVLLLHKDLLVQDTKKKLCAKDSQLLASAQRLICSEISIVIDKEYDLAAEKGTDFDILYQSVV